MYCIMCGRELPEDATVCPGCGHRISYSIHTEDTSQREVSADGNSETQREAQPDTTPETQSEMKKESETHSADKEEDKRTKNTYSLLGLIFSCVNIVLISLAPVFLWLLFSLPVLVIVYEVIVVIVALYSFIVSFVGYKFVNRYGHKRMATTALCLSSVVIGLFVINLLMRLVMTIMYGI